MFMFRQKSIYPLITYKHEIGCTGLWLCPDCGCALSVNDQMDSGSILPVYNNDNNQQQEPPNLGTKDLRRSRTAQNILPSSSLRKKSDVSLLSKVRWGVLRHFLANLQEVFLRTKLSLLFPAIPLAIVANYCHFGSAWVFTLSLLGLALLAEHLCFLTEQIAYYTGPTVGGLMNATCGNATELIVALFALHEGNIDLVKSSLLGSVLSNLLLVLGSSLLVGSLANLATDKYQHYDRRQADVSIGLLLLGVLCHILPLMISYKVTASAEMIASDSSIALGLSRACSIIMLVVYSIYVFFQLKTHRDIFQVQEDLEGENNDEVASEDTPVISLASGILWLVGMTIVIAVLSDYIVDTIEEASNSWRLPVRFASLILLPIVGNATEHAGAIIFAYKNKLDITLGVSLGSAAQISILMVPLSVVVAWIMGVPMDLDFDLLETGALLLSVLITAFTLQDGTSHYLKGIVLLLSYVAIAASFFVTPQITPVKAINSNLEATQGGNNGSI